MVAGGGNEVLTALMNTGRTKFDSVFIYTILISPLLLLLPIRLYALQMSHEMILEVRILIIRINRRHSNTYSRRFSFKHSATRVRSYYPASNTRSSAKACVSVTASNRAWLPSIPTKEAAVTPIGFIDIASFTMEPLDDKNGPDVSIDEFGIHVSK